MLGLDLSVFGPDAVEIAIPDATIAERLIAAHEPDFIDFVVVRVDALTRNFGMDWRGRGQQYAQALALGYARMAVRCGHWGSDLHHYHNEQHVREIIDRRLFRLSRAVGLDRYPPLAWVALTLFGVFHDLRQREHPSFEQGVGANERASLAEGLRILDCVGLTGDQELKDALELMIAGSTFDAREKAPRPLLSAEAVMSGGALAPRLVQRIKDRHPEWRTDPKLAGPLEWALIASDLDTANVAEALHLLADSATRLCMEIETRAGRPEIDIRSAQFVLDFLTRGQERYFFDLHRFHSAAGEATFAEVKARNAPLLLELSRRMHSHYGVQVQPFVGGREILGTYLAEARKLDPE